MTLRLLDRKQVIAELGVTQNMADKVFRELEGKQVRPKGMRRVFVRWVDLEELVNEGWMRK